MSSAEHQKMVKKIIDDFESKGLRITCADYTGYDKCDEIDDYIPDVSGYDDTNELWYLGEAETCESVKKDHTKKQIQAFAGRTMTKGKSKGKPVPLYVAVPKECKDDLEAVLKELGLETGKEVYRWNLN